MNRAEAIEFAREQQEIFGGKMSEFLEFVENELTQTNTSNALNALDCVDTISRAKVIEDIDYWIAHKSSASRVKGSFTDGMIDAYCRIKSDVRLMPSAERRGKWEFIGGYGYQYRCSVCITCAEHKTRYCPNCGAKMEENND